MSEAALGQRLRASGLWAASGRIMSGVLLLALHSVLARSLTTTDYGRYVLIESAALILSLLCMAGVPSVTLRLMRSNLANGDTSGAACVVASTLRLFLLTSITTAVLTAGSVWLLSDSQTGDLNRTVLPWFVVWAVLSAGLRILSEAYRAYDRYPVAYSIGGQSGGFVVNVCLMTAAVAAVVSGRMTLTTILAIQVIVQLTVIVLSTVELHRLVPALWSGGSTKVIGLLLASSLPMLIQQLASIGMPEAGKLLLGTWASAEETGMYNAALRLVVLAHVPLMIANTAVQPFVTELYAAGRKQQLTTLVRGCATLAAMPCLAVFGVFLIAPEFILNAAFGPAFVGAAPALRILTLGSIAWVLSGSCGLVLMMTGHERSCMLGTIVSGVVYVALCPWLISEYGVLGAATAATILQFVSNGLCMLLVYHHLRIWTGITFSNRIVRDCIHLIKRKG